MRHTHGPGHSRHGASRAPCLGAFRGSLDCQASALPPDHLVFPWLDVSRGERMEPVMSMSDVPVLQTTASAVAADKGTIGPCGTLASALFFTVCFRLPGLGDVSRTNDSPAARGRRCKQAAGRCGIERQRMPRFASDSTRPTHMGRLPWPLPRARSGMSGGW